MSIPPRKERITAEEMRAMFNRGAFWERTLEEEFIVTRRKNRLIRAQPTPTDGTGVGIPDGTRSQIWEYIDRRTRKRVAIVHQYLRPDGMIGGWGRPDPKVILQDGVEYYIDTAQEP